MRISTLVAFANLSTTERFLALRALGLLQYYWCAVRLRSLASLQANTARQPLGPQSTVALSQVAALCKRASQIFPWCNNCLVRSLATERLLRSVGYEVKLIIGVARENSDTALHSMSAHAWLEDSSGKVLFDEEPVVGSYVKLS